jgi:signal transduction histidine kinase
MLLATDLHDERGEALAPERTPWAEALASGLPVRHRIIHLTTPSGHARWLSVNAIPVANADPDRRADSVAISLSDVTEHQQAENLKEQFLTVVSHELRTPLTSIRGYLEMMGDEEFDEDDRRMFIASVERNVDRLQRLIGDLTFVASLEDGDGSLEIEPACLAELVGGVAATMRPAAEDAGVDLRVALQAPPVVPCDAHRIEQVFENVIGNAIKFTPGGGTVTIEVWVEGDCAVIEVEDSGIGIAATDRDRIFDRFFRATSAVQDEKQGSGLGLTIAKAVIEAHNGVIDVRSAEGVGTTVRIELPCGAPVPPAASPAQFSANP